MNRIWNFSAFGSRPALTDDTGVTVRYNELAELQDQLAGIGPGELTMMLCENSIGALAGYAALINSGHPMLMVSSGMPEDMRRNIMNTYRPGMVFAPRLLQKHYSNMQELRTIDDYVLLKTNYSEQYSVFPELGQLLTTSGSTGSVKFVRQSRSNILINAMNYAVDLGITETERTVTSLPLHYTYALTNYSASLLTGAVMVVTRLGIMDEEFWDSMKAFLMDGAISYGESWALDKLCHLAAQKRIAPKGEDPDAYLMRLGVKDGLGGLNFKKSEFCPGGTDDIKIVVSYQAHMVDFFGLDLNFNLEQTALTKAWCGIKPSVYKNTNDSSSGTGDSSESDGGDGSGKGSGNGEDEDGDSLKDMEEASKLAPGEEEKVEPEKEKSVQEWARESTHNPYSDSVFLGRYIKEGNDGWEYSYDQLGESNGYTYFSMSSDDYNKLKEEKGLDYVWDINEEFLRNQEIAGKTFYLSSSPYNVPINSTYYMEVEWLESRGYTFEFNEAVGMWKAVRK